MALAFRIIGPFVIALISCAFYVYASSHRLAPVQKRRLLLTVYLGSRVSLWLFFSIFLQKHVTSSDPFYYTTYMAKFLAGQVPVRDFFYPYGPFLIPSIIPFYLLLGRRLSGISLFGIFAEAVALTFFVKSLSITRKRGETTESWAYDALALYLLNPATLYYTVLQGYNSIIQTAYLMPALYLLLRGKNVWGYAVGLYGLAGSKLLAVLDWPALLTVRRPRLTAILLGALPLIATYTAYQGITGDILFPIRTHVSIISPGNVWYVLWAFPRLHPFLTGRIGLVLPSLLFAVLFLLGFVRWIWCVREGRASFSFPAALGMSTFCTSLFFLCSRYTSGSYVPIVLFPASLVATSPRWRSRRIAYSLLAVSALCSINHTLSHELGTPRGLLGDVFASGSTHQRVFGALIVMSSLISVFCFTLLARAGLQTATAKHEPGREAPTTSA